MIQTYREQLTDDVWTGKHDSIWPGTADEGPKYAAWRKDMLSIKHDFEVALAQLEETMMRNAREQKDISALQTQVSELFGYYLYQDHQPLLKLTLAQLMNANAVQDARISVLQGRNIKILTLVGRNFLDIWSGTNVFRSRYSSFPSLFPRYRLRSMETRYLY